VTRLTHAELLLRDYGIDHPNQIDLEVLAWTLGAKVKYRRMDSCEARIVGNGDKAIITVDDRFGVKRARFSLSHEIGHWQRHRNQVLYCSKDDIGSTGRKASAKERQADAYAADLMMPGYLFKPIARAFSAPSFKSIDELSTTFDASRKATAMRYVDLDPSPSLLICYGQYGRKWYRPSPGWPEDWAPKRDHDPDTDVLDLVFGRQTERTTRSLHPANAFFGHYNAQQFDVYAHSVFSGAVKDIKSREVLTLIIPKSVDMFDTERSYLRSW
jgi:uncharacterized protein DUF955